MGRCELLRAVKFVQEQPGGVRVYLHQVEEKAVERRRKRVRARGRAAGAPPQRLLSGLLEKKMIIASLCTAEQSPLSFLIQGH